MLKLNVNFLKAGMTVGRTVYNSDGNILISEGLRLKEKYIKKLINLGIHEIYVLSEDASDTDIRDVIQQQNRREAQKIIRQTMQKIQIGEKISTQKIYDMVVRILDDLLNNSDIMVNLSDIKAIDDYTFAHSVNVCVLSLITGVMMGYDRDRLTKLGMGAILHDIGKTAVSSEILNKPSSLTEEEYTQMKKHAKLGYEILKEYPGIDPLSAAVVLEHHERYDGKGYPFGKKALEIHEFSRIVAVADVYDALTSNRVYKKKIFSHQAVEYLISMGNHQFDYAIVRKFISRIAHYPIGTILLLNTGVKAVVIGNDKNYPNRPKVRYLADWNGKKYDQIKEVELVKHPSIMIEEVLENI